MIKDPINFLANVAAVARADGKVTVAEQQQIEEIRTELKLKKPDLTAALRAVEGGGFRPTPVGGFAEQVMNLHLMLRVAYCDGDLHEAESRVIEDFCVSVGIQQHQLDQMCQEVLNIGFQGPKACPKCGSSASQEARFCASCGEALRESELTPANEFHVPSIGITVQFAESTAGSFAEVLSIAQGNPHFESKLRGKKSWYSVHFPSGEIKEVLPLALALSGLRNRRLYINGNECSWNDVFGFVWCESMRGKSYRPETYCFGRDENRVNPWGCKLARMEWSEWASWFSYGNWEKVADNEVIWRFDKERIRHEVYANTSAFRFCPHLRFDLIEAFVRLIPDVVSPESDPSWKYNQNYEQTPGALKVLERSGSGVLSITNEYWSDGVRPKGLSVLEDLLTEALAEVGGCGVTARALLP